MGAWGEYVFDNDASGDFWAQLKYKPVGDSALAAVVDPVTATVQQSYLEVDEGAELLVCIVLICGLQDQEWFDNYNGNIGDTLRDEINEFLEKNRPVWNQRYAAKKYPQGSVFAAALDALGVVTEPTISEMAELWREAANDTWKVVCGDLTQELVKLQ